MIFYGPSIPNIKGFFVDSFADFGDQHRRQPWILGAYFKIITSIEEKKGGMRRLDLNNLCFKETLENMNLNVLHTINENKN